MYEHGSGVPQDYVKARHYYEQAADQDHTLAQYSLGRLYHNGNGNGVTQDYEAARHYYKLAVDQGYALAQRDLG